MLAASIREQGILQPILVRTLGSSLGNLRSSSEGNAEYEILAGERRYQAAKLAGLEKVPVVVKEVPDKEALAIALIENIRKREFTSIGRSTGAGSLG